MVNPHPYPKDDAGGAFNSHFQDGHSPHRDRQRGRRPESVRTNYKIMPLSLRMADIHTTLKSHKPTTLSERQNIRKHPVCLQILNLELQASLTQSFAYLKQPFNEATSSKHVS